MADIVLNVLLGLVASAISATLGWLAQTGRRRQRLGRIREFFGMPGGAECLLVVNRHASAVSSSSVERNDVYALLELAALVKECNARAEIVAHDEVRQGLGRKAEFCVGGPGSNRRTAAHLASWLPGISFADWTGPGSELAITVGDHDYRHTSGTPERPGGQTYALLARLHEGGDSPVFLIAGQTAVSNHAAVRFLTANHRRLARQYGRNGTFALVLSVVNPGAYGPDVVEVAADVTAEATARPAAVAA
ncbi:hypothetical protein ABT095_08560 [Kitasatospora sp. NPDC002227]|uniref:hypothetical protein n=1 Tax=Kitasatospora sp. NPDC002227 TaxID=3154773 RepID=UPI0033333BCF